MKGAQILAAEFAVALALNAWPQIVAGYIPWPAHFVRTALGFSVIAVLAFASDELAALLAAGFIIVLFIKDPDYYMGHMAKAQYLQGKHAPAAGTGEEVYSNQLLTWNANLAGTNQGGATPPTSGNPNTNPKPK